MIFTAPIPLLPHEQIIYGLPTPAPVIDRAGRATITLNADTTADLPDFPAFREADPNPRGAWSFFFALEFTTAPGSNAHAEIVFNSAHHFPADSRALGYEGKVVNFSGTTLTLNKTGNGENTAALDQNGKLAFIILPKTAPPESVTISYDPAAVTAVKWCVMSKVMGIIYPTVQITPKRGFEKRARKTITGRDDISRLSTDPVFRGRVRFQKESRPEVIDLPDILDASTGFTIFPGGLEAGFVAEWRTFPFSRRVEVSKWTDWRGHGGLDTGAQDGTLDFSETYRGIRRGTTGGIIVADYNGWSPVLGAVDDGERVVFRVVSWTGGTGTPPDSGKYISPVGLTTDIREATDVRGLRGLPGLAGADGGVDTFGELTDTPAAIEAGKFLAGSADGSKLVYVEGGGSGDVDLTPYQKAIAPLRTSTQYKRGDVFEWRGNLLRVRYDLTDANGAAQTFAQHLPTWNDETWRALVQSVGNAGAAVEILVPHADIKTLEFDEDTGYLTLGVFGGVENHTVQITTHIIDHNVSPGWVKPPNVDHVATTPWHFTAPVSAGEGTWRFSYCPTDGDGNAWGAETNHGLAVEILGAIVVGDVLEVSGAGGKAVGTVTAIEPAANTGNRDVNDNCPIWEAAFTVDKAAANFNNTSNVNFTLKRRNIQTSAIVLSGDPNADSETDGMTASAIQRRINSIAQVAGDFSIGTAEVKSFVAYQEPTLPLGATVPAQSFQTMLGIINNASAHNNADYAVPTTLAAGSQADGNYTVETINHNGANRQCLVITLKERVDSFSNLLFYVSSDPIEFPAPNIFGAKELAAYTKNTPGYYSIQNNIAQSSNTHRGFVVFTDGDKKIYIYQTGGGSEYLGWINLQRIAGSKGAAGVDGSQGAFAVRLFTQLNTTGAGSASTAPAKPDGNWVWVEERGRLERKTGAPSADANYSFWQDSTDGIPTTVSGNEGKLWVALALWNPETNTIYSWNAPELVDKATANGVLGAHGINAQTWGENILQTPLTTTGSYSLPGIAKATDIGVVFANSFDGKSQIHTLPRDLSNVQIDTHAGFFTFRITKSTETISFDFIQSSGSKISAVYLR